MDAACATVGHICKLKKRNTHTPCIHTYAEIHVENTLSKSQQLQPPQQRERWGGLVRDERDREEGEDAKKKKRSEKGEKEKDRGRRGSMCQQ